MATIFERVLGRVLSEMDGNLPPRAAKLAQMVQAVAADLGTQLRNTGLTPPAEDDYGEANFEIFDREGTVLWLKFACTVDGKIAYYDILAAPSRGQEWDFVDMDIGYSYDEFLGDVADVEVEPPAKDYGLDFLNIVAWVIHAHQQIAKQEPDLENLYENGYYKVKLTLRDQHGSATTGYWVEASSSEDARQQVIDMAGTKLVGDPTIIQFSREKVEY